MWKGTHIILVDTYSTVLIFQVFELGPSLYVVELRKSYGDSILYRQVTMHSSIYHHCLSEKLVQLYVHCCI